MTTNSYVSASEILHSFGQESQIFKRLRDLKERQIFNKDIIDLSIGAPDMPPDKPIIDALVDSVYRRDVHSYPLGKGEFQLRENIARWYRERFGVIVDPEREVLPVIGAKRAVIDLTIGVVNPGRTVLIPELSYPSYRIATHLAGGNTYEFRTAAEENFIPHLDHISSSILAQTSLLFLNYPHNPTGAIVGTHVFKESIDLAKKYKFVVCHDNPYSEITFDGYVAPSFLQFSGAKEVGVELFSFSKIFNMAGWRIACFVGNANIIETIRNLRGDLDSGIFTPIQYAAARALEIYEQKDIHSRQSNRYEERRNTVLECLQDLGWGYFKPKGAIYVWATPPAFDSVKFVEEVFGTTGVLMTPGDAYGSAGIGKVRVGLVRDSATLREAFQRIGNTEKFKKRRYLNEHKPSR